MSGMRETILTLEELEAAMATPGRIDVENMEQAMESRVQLVEKLHASRPKETDDDFFAAMPSGLPKGTEMSPFNDIEVSEEAIIKAAGEAYGPEAEENMREALKENRT